MKNLYKYMSVFRCVHETHRGFQNQMSVYHIMEKKKCFPHGCFYFKWHCKLMEKGDRCYRGYNFVGKNCSGCRYFYEEKIHNYSELQISEEEYRQFLKEYRDFEDWVYEHENKEIEIHGIIHGIKPDFRKRVFKNGESISFRGFILIFDGIYFDLTHMEEFVYARISSKTYRNLQFGKGDKVTARGTLTLDKGRFVVIKLHRFDIEARGEPAFWTESKALVARETATHIPLQPEGCIRCPHGALIDVEDVSRRDSRNYRQLYCLQGMADYRNCHHLAEYCGMDAEANEALDPGCLTGQKVTFVGRNARKHSD